MFLKYSVQAAKVNTINKCCHQLPYLFKNIFVNDLIDLKE